MKKAAPIMLAALLAMGCAPATTQVKDAPAPRQEGIAQGEVVPTERVGVKGVEAKPAKPVVLWKPEKKAREFKSPEPETAPVPAGAAPTPAPVAKVEPPEPKIEPGPPPKAQTAPARKVEPLPERKAEPVPAPVAKAEPVLTPAVKIEPPPAPKLEPAPAPKNEPSPVPVAKAEPTPAPKAEPPPPPVPSKSPREYLMEARSEFMAGRNKTALEAVVKAREGFPGELEPALLEARIRYALDDVEEGFKLLEGFIRREEGGAEVLDTYVNWAAQKGLAPRAVAFLDALKAAKPAPDPAIAGPLGWLHYKTGNAQAALENFDLTENTPYYPKWAVFIARLRLQNSDTARAKAAAALAANGAVQARTVAAEALAIEGRPTEAEALLQNPLPGDAGGYEAILGLGLLKLNQGDPKGAAEQFRNAAKREPGRPEAFNNLGVALRAAMDETGAAEAFGKALEVSPDYPPALKNLGILKEKFQGDYAGAVALYARYMEKLPGDKEVERYLKAATRSAADEAKAAQEPQEGAQTPGQEGTPTAPEGGAPVEKQGEGR